MVTKYLFLPQTADDWGCRSRGRRKRPTIRGAPVCCWTELGGRFRGPRLRGFVTGSNNSRPGLQYGELVRHELSAVDEANRAIAVATAAGPPSGW